MSRYFGTVAALLFVMTVPAPSKHHDVAAEAPTPAEETTTGEDAAIWIADEFGEMAIFPMENAPYPHESRAEGHEYNGTKFPRDPHYIDNSVVLFLPHNYSPDETVDLLYYWHGWGNNVRKATAEFRLREQVVGAGKNVIFVFPQGPKDSSDSRCGRLEEEGALAALTDEVMAKLKAEEKIPAEAALGRVLLSGHSGAYRVMAECAKHGGLEENLSEIYLLDASYALLDQFADWLARRPAARLRSIYTEHLRSDNEELMAMLDAREIAYIKTTDTEVNDAQLDDDRVVFMATMTRDHNQAVEVLERWLRNSRLDDIPDEQ